MSDIRNVQKYDLRVIKTEQALITSMFFLLNECTFKKLTVDSICRKGQVSRAAFYSHFTDKYDLLKFWLSSFWKYTVDETDTYEVIKERINKFINENRKILKNILFDASVETLDIVVDFLCLVLDIESKRYIDGKIIQKNIVLSNLYIGGIVYYLLWQVRNNFPLDIPVINEYSFGAIKNLWDWSKDQ